jgi:hypothetical protein
MSRSLTPGEIALLRPWFGKALDYGAIRVHRGHDLNPFAAAAFFNRNPAIALGRHIHVMKRHYRDDYAAGPLADFAGFVAHEATHVWQWRTGRFNPLTYFWQYWTWPHHGYDIRKVTAQARFDSLGYDQQAEVVRWAVIWAGTARGDELRAVLEQRLPEP